jgi:hypothetical protein
MGSQVCGGGRSQARTIRSNWGRKVNDGLRTWRKQDRIESSLGKGEAYVHGRVCP